MKAILLDGSVTANPKQIYDQYFSTMLSTDPGSTIGNVLEGVGISRYIDSPLPNLFSIKRRVINTFEPLGWEVNDVTYDNSGTIRIDALPPRN